MKKSPETGDFCVFILSINSLKSDTGYPSLSQLGTISYNLINRIRQELDGITEWFIC